MSSECSHSSPQLDYNQFLKDITWLNEDYPEANLALLEGIRNGFNGYKEDNIIRPFHPKSNDEDTSFDGGINYKVKKCYFPIYTLEIFLTIFFCPI